MTVSPLNAPFSLSPADLDCIVLLFPGDKNCRSHRDLFLPDILPVPMNYLNCLRPSYSHHRHRVYRTGPYIRHFRHPRLYLQRHPFRHWQNKQTVRKHRQESVSPLCISPYWLPLEHYSLLSLRIITRIHFNKASGACRQAVDLLSLIWRG